MKIGLIKCSSLILFLITSIGFAKNNYIDVINQTSNSLTIKATFPQPKVLHTEKIKKEYFFIENMSLLQESGFPAVPYISEIFSLPGTKVHYRIQEIVTGQKSFDNYLFNILPLNSRKSDLNAPIKNKNFIHITYKGLFRDTPVFCLNIFPVKINTAAKKAEYIETITVEIYLSDQVNKTNQLLPQAKPLKERALLSKCLLNSVTREIKPAAKFVNQESGQPYKSGRVKIFIKEDGLYKISYDDLVQAGININQYDTRRLRLLNKGYEIPVYFKGAQDGKFDSGDYFEFWGEMNKSNFIQQYPDIYSDPFSDVNVYWLESSNQYGLRMVEESGALIDNGLYIPYQYTETIHCEKDNSFDRLGHETANLDSPSYTLDHWFFDQGISNGGKKSYFGFLPYPAETGMNSVYVKVMMRGKTFYSGKDNPIENHIVNILLNNETVASTEGSSWKDQTYKLISNTQGISQSIIRHGNNELIIFMNQPLVTDIVLLNWYEIEYQRRYRADKNFIKFKKQQLGIPPSNKVQFEIDGFTHKNIELYKLGVSKIVNSRIDFPDQTSNLKYRISFQDEIQNTDMEYIAITPENKKKPLQISEDLPWRGNGEEQYSLFEPLNSAQYLIITHDLFYTNSIDVKNYRQRNDFPVEIVKVEDIYDEFNFGIKSPLAIKEFLRYVFYNWDQNNRLQYVYFIGDAQFNYKSDKDFVPTFLFETLQYGAAASDHLYSLISGEDDIPDLFIGRLPVTNNAELIAYMEKLQNYEQNNNVNAWRNTGLFISGNDAKTYDQFTEIPIFRGQNQRLINWQMPDGYFTRKLNTVKDDSKQVDPNYGSTTDLIKYFNDGVSLVLFFGHGGGGVWADVQLLNLNHVDQLNNGNCLPFVMSMTCFTGAFEGGSRPALAEKLVLAENKGAIAVFSSSGLGWAHNDFAISWKLPEYLFRENISIGEAIALNKIYYYNDGIYFSEETNEHIPGFTDLRKSMVYQYNLLGDPYLKLQMPDEELIVGVNNSTPDIGETVNVTVTAPFSSGTGRIEYCNNNNEPVDILNINLNNYSFQSSFLIPADLQDQDMSIKAYVTNEARDAAGMVKLGINKAILDSLVITPSPPQIGDTIQFAVYLSSPYTIVSGEIEIIKGISNRLASLPLSKLNDSKWVCQYSFNEAGNALVQVTVRDVNSKTYIFKDPNFEIIDPRPDLKIVNNSFKFAGDTAIGLSVRIENDSKISIPSCRLEIYDVAYSAHATPFVDTLLNFAPHQARESVFVILDNQRLYSDRSYTAVIQVPDNIGDRNESNNIVSGLGYNSDTKNQIFNIARTIGTTNDGVTNDTILLGNIGRLYLAPKSLSVSSTLSFKLLEKGQMATNIQPDFTHLHLNQQNNGIAQLTLHNKSAAVLNKIYFELTMDASISNTVNIDSVEICRYQARMNQWLKAADKEVRSDSLDRVFVNIDRLGEFALFDINDDKAPLVEITVNGRNFYDNMLIPENPNIAFILQDENGVNLSSGFRVFIDADSLSKDELSMPDTIKNTRAVSLLATPKLSTGNHTLELQVTDTNGNLSEKSILFAVAENFSIEVHGNYPNPFTDETYISFYNNVSPSLDHFSLKIYTVSGRLIREFNADQYEFQSDAYNWKAPWYHEIRWDGTDEEGNFVANGVYFAVLKAVYKGETIKKTLKLAKLK
jgi:hypothetical protein